MAARGYSLLKNSNLKFDEEWPKIRPVVLKLIHQEAVSKEEWQQLFWIVHSLCSWIDGGAQMLLDVLQKEVAIYVKAAAARVLVEQEDRALLKTYIDEWRRFATQSIYLPMPFTQLDNQVAASSSAGNSPAMTPRLQQPHHGGSAKSSPSHSKPQQDGLVRKMMLEMWNQYIFTSIQSRLQASAMQLVAAERNGEPFDSQLVIGVRESYVSLCPSSKDRLEIYRDHFEASYIASTEEYYRAKAPQVLADNGVLRYMVYADEKIQEEEAWANKYLETSHGSNSVQLLLQKCVDVLVVAFEDQIQAECSVLIKANDIPKLQLMFRLLDRSPTGIRPVIKSLEDHICSQGLADMMDNAEIITTDSAKYVEQLLEMFNRFSQLVKEAFYDDPKFLTARDKAFQDVVNQLTTSVFKLELPTQRQKTSNSKTQAESKCPELLANYCDLLLRKSPLSRKLTPDEVDAKLREVLLVLKYVQNKDVFMRYYKSHLARRLILDASADAEKEELMVNKLREAGMPADYINKLYRMLMDVEMSRELNKKFKSSACSNNNRSGANSALPAATVSEMVNIKILNAGAWSRTSERVPVSLPRELEDFIPEVEDFYRSQHSGRKLRWYHHMSNGTIQMCSNVGRFDLEVTTFQMAVLFCWNERPGAKISYENLRLATGLPDFELRRTLWSLVSFPKIKHQVLVCDCSSKNPKDFADITLFWTNEEFCIVKNGKPQKRGRINLIGRLQLSVEQSREEENDAIVQLRILRVQEAIVKIMKMRKKLSNAQLQTELVEMLKMMFLPSRKMIKEQIEWLIENRYMARDEDDINTFLYLA